MKRDEQLAEQAKKMQKGLDVKIEGDTVLVTAKGDLYEDSLPDGVSMQTVKEIEKYNHNYIDAGTTAVVNEVEKAFKKNKKLATATATLPFGNSGSMTTNVVREKTYRNPASGKEFTAPAVNTAVKWVGAKGSAAYQKRLRANLAEAIAGK